MEKQNNNSFEAYFELGNSYEKNKDYKNALINLKKAINVNNQCYLCHYTMSKIYEKLCKYEFSIFHLEKVIKIRPNFYDALFSMAQCYRKMKNEIKMLEYLKKTLAKVPEHASANHLLASANKETCSKYSLEYTENLFDRYAGHFENHLLSSLKYKVPFIIKEKLKSLKLLKSSKVLDLGCGTGLIGKKIVDLFPYLVGVDISTNMINETRKKEIYSKLYVNDIDNFLLENKKEFDLIIAADVFIYIGNIQTIFEGIKKSISNNGYFIFTIELSLEIDIKNFQLGKTGRFSHDINYIKSLCKDIGFMIEDIEEIILRQEDMIDQKGVIFTLQKL